MSKLRRFGHPPIVPSGQASLRVGVEHDNWCVPCLGCNGEAADKRRLSRSALLRGGNHYFHELLPHRRKGAFPLISSVFYQPCRRETRACLRTYAPTSIETVFRLNKALA